MNYSPIKCPICTYDRNLVEAENCELCGTSLAEVAGLAALGSSKQPLRSHARNADVSHVRAARKHAGQSNTKTKLFDTKQQREAGANPEKLISSSGKAKSDPSSSHSDPWLSSSPELNSSAPETSYLNEDERADSNGVKQRTNNRFNRIVTSRLTSTKARAIAKVLLIVAAMFGISSATTVFINHRYNREQLSLASPEEPPSKYSDIKLYETMKAVPNVPNGLFSYGGALCFAALQRDGMNMAISNAHPSFRLRYVEPKFSNPGCTTGIKMLLDGELSIAQNSRPLTEAEKREATAAGYKLESIPVAIDGIVFYTNKSLGIKSLSLSQVRDIYFGKIRNWKQVGGKDLPITPIGLDPEIDSILRLLMETKNTPLIGENVFIARDYTTAIRKTSSTPGAISYASSAIAKGQRSITPIALSANSESPPVSALLADGMPNLQAFEKNVYPLTRRLFVVIRRDGTPEEEAGVAYTNFLLSKEGQGIFKQAGFVPLY